MNPYSQDLRERVMAASDEGVETRAELAERFGVSPSFVTKLRRRRRETGSVAAKPHAGGFPPGPGRAPAAGPVRIGGGAAGRDPGRAAGPARRPPGRGPGRPHDRLAGPGPPGPAAQKKSAHAAERHTPRVRGTRGAYARELGKVPRRKRVYVDETGATTGMTRARGRAAPGWRVVERVPEAGWQVTTLVGAVRLGERPAAALAFDGAADGAAFETSVAEHLCPTLRRGDAVVLDRLGAHRGAAVRRAVEAAGATLLYLPPYSNDLNPIEDVWSKVKGHLRAAKARTRPDLIDAMGDALRSVTPADTRGYFAHRDFHQRGTLSREPL